MGNAQAGAGRSTDAANSSSSSGAGVGGPRWTAEMGRGFVEEERALIAQAWRHLAATEAACSGLGSSAHVSVSGGDVDAAAVERMLSQQWKTNRRVEARKVSRRRLEALFRLHLSRGLRDACCCPDHQRRHGQRHLLFAAVGDEEDDSAAVAAAGALAQYIVDQVWGTRLAPGNVTFPNDMHIDSHSTGESPGRGFPETSRSRVEDGEAISGIARVGESSKRDGEGMEVDAAGVGGSGVGLASGTGDELEWEQFVGGVSRVASRQSASASERVAVLMGVARRFSRFLAESSLGGSSAAGGAGAAGEASAAAAASAAGGGTGQGAGGRTGMASLSPDQSGGLSPIISGGDAAVQDRRCVIAESGNADGSRDGSGAGEGAVAADSSRGVGLFSIGEQEAVVMSDCAPKVELQQQQQQQQQCKQAPQQTEAELCCVAWAFFGLAWGLMAESVSVQLVAECAAPSTAVSPSELAAVAEGCESRGHDGRGSAGRALPASTQQACMHCSCADTAPAFAAAAASVWDDSVSEAISSLSRGACKAASAAAAAAAAAAATASASSSGFDACKGGSGDGCGGGGETSGPGGGVEGNGNESARKGCSNGSESEVVLWVAQNLPAFADSLGEFVLMRLSQLGMGSGSCSSCGGGGVGGAAVACKGGAGGGGYGKAELSVGDADRHNLHQRKLMGNGEGVHYKAPVRMRSRSEQSLAQATADRSVSGCIDKGDNNSGMLSRGAAWVLGSTLTSTLRRPAQRARSLSSPAQNFLVTSLPQDTDLLEWAFRPHIECGKGLKGLPNAPWLLYRASEHGRGVRRMLARTEGYGGTWLVLLSLRPPSPSTSPATPLDNIDPRSIASSPRSKSISSIIAGGSSSSSGGRTRPGHGELWHIAAVVRGSTGVANRMSFYCQQSASASATSGSCLLCLAPTVAVRRTTGRGNNVVFSHAKIPGKTGAAAVAAGGGAGARVSEGLGFGGSLGKERVWLDDAFSKATFRHHAMDRTFQPGRLLPPIEGVSEYADMQLTVADVEVWGLGGPRAMDALTASQQREALFVEQRRKVDLKKFVGDWNESAEKAMLGMVSDPNKPANEQR